MTEIYCEHELCPNNKNRKCSAKAIIVAPNGVCRGRKTRQLMKALALQEKGVLLQQIDMLHKQLKLARKEIEKLKEEVKK